MKTISCDFNTEIFDCEEQAILDTFDRCARIYRRYGVTLKFPKNTDPRKTYQWRYVSNLHNKFAEWEFDGDDRDNFINIVAAYARKHNLIIKGLSVFGQNNILKICYENVADKINSRDQSITSLSRIYSMLEAKSGDRGMLEFLLKRKTPDSFCNLSILYSSSNITSLYMSMSKSCYGAMRRLSQTHPFECDRLPRLCELFEIRKKFLVDSSTFDLVKKILKSDWRELCQ